MDITSMRALFWHPILGEQLVLERAMVMTDTVGVMKGEEIVGTISCKVTGSRKH